ncbi:hypothetical protein G6F59_013812 [Rhizopus arrhizus]|nr:hypothetical protein G6F59_013812 [Rhizopus arrhizus]
MQAQRAGGAGLAFIRLQRKPALHGLVGAALAGQQHAERALLVGGVAGGAAGAGVVTGHHPVVVLEVQPAGGCPGVRSGRGDQGQQGDGQELTHGHPFTWAGPQSAQPGPPAPA